MKAIQYIKRIHHFGSGGFQSMEQPGKTASNSEIVRWFKQNIVHINGASVSADTWVDLDEIESLVLFPKSLRRKVTLI